MSDHQSDVPGRAMPYHDYVIKDGKLVGRFEEMYQACDDPWHQSSVAYNAGSISRHATILNIRKYGIRSVVEFGCGLGYYTDMIHRATGVRIRGVDIAPTAIARARRLWPHLEFAVGRVQDSASHADVEAVLLAEITWYVLDDFAAILETIARSFPGGLLLHNLVFYKHGQRYGREFFTNLTEFVAYMPFPLLGYCEGSATDADTVETSTIFRIEPKGR